MDHKTIILSLSFYFFVLNYACERVDRKTPFLWALQYQEIEHLSVLIKDHTIDIHDDRGNTLLIELATARQYDISIDKILPLILHCLIDYGADINAQNNEGDTALIKAIKNRSFKIACELIYLGADSHKIYRDKETADSLVQKYMREEELLSRGNFPSIEYFVLAGLRHMFKEYTKTKIL